MFKTKRNQNQRRRQRHIGVDERVRIISSKQEARYMKYIISLAIFSAFCLFVTLMMFRSYKSNAIELIETQNKYEALLTDQLELSSQYDTLYETYEGVHAEYVKNVEYTAKCEETIAGLQAMVESLDKQSKKLAKSNDDYYNRIKQYEKREELFDKYEYAIVREDGTRTDITYDQLIKVQDLAKEKNVDVDLVLAITMVESDGTEKCKNSSSTARGYGQFLQGTGEFVYEDLMKAGNYSHEFALNGETNFTMMVNYLDYLNKKNDNDLYATIKNYRGRGGSILTNYINKIDNYLEKKHKSVDSINRNMI